MRYFNKKRDLNLKYIIGEIILLFIGINLAIWFNNWNSSNKLNDDKNIALNKITEEINNNLLEIDSVLFTNRLILNAY